MMLVDIKLKKDLSKLFLTLDLQELQLVQEFSELLKELVMEVFISLIIPEDSQVVVKIKKERRLNILLKTIKIEFLVYMFKNGLMEFGKIKVKKYMKEDSENGQNALMIIQLR